MNDTNIVDVLIVGAGPVGMTLAIELARRGVSFRIIDKASAYAVGSRARGVSPRTQEIFADFGVSEALRTYASPPLPMRFFDGDNNLVREIDPAANAAASPSPSAPYYPLMVGQQHTEAVLRQVLASLDVHVEMGCTLTNLAQDADVVTAGIEHDQHNEQIQSRFLVGCDGGHSAVRKCAGISFQGETWGEDITFFGNVSVSGLDASYWYSWTDPVKGSMNLQPMQRDGNWFFAATLAPDENGDLPPASLETLQRLFSERVALPGVHFSDPSWLSIWRPNIRMVDRYRSDRVFLAGDSAHVHSAAGGQGMNTGIQDAYNLGWKLAAVLNGAPDSLLDTYEAERLPVAQGVLAATSARHHAFRQSDSEGKSVGVQAVINTLSGKDPFADITQLSISYRGSPLAVDMDDTTGIRAGDRAPDAPNLQSESGEKTRLFDLLRGPQFTLLNFGGRVVPQLPDAYRNDVRIYTIMRPESSIHDDYPSMIDCDGYAHSAYGVNEDALILVRPDKYVGFTGASIQGVIVYLHKVMGQ